MPVKSIWKSDAAQASALPFALATLIGMLAPGAAFCAESANPPVRQRPHPEADPTGLARNGVLFYPGVLAGMEFDSNIYASSRNPAEDMALALALELRIRSDSEAAQHALDLGASHHQYQSFDSENRTEAHARLKSARRLATDVKLDTLFEAARKFEPRDSSVIDLSVWSPSGAKAAELSNLTKQIREELDRIVSSARTELQVATLIVASEQTSRGAVKAALQETPGIEAKILGAAMNRVQDDFARNYPEYGSFHKVA